MQSVDDEFTTLAQGGGDEPGDDDPSGEVATMTAGTNGSAATVNEKDAIKVGTSRAGGDMTITVPAGATSLVFYAAAWNGATNASISITPEAKVNSSSISLTADEGISGNSPFTLTGTETTYKHTVSLINISEETTFTLSAGSRFVVWGATYTTPGGEDTPTKTTPTLSFSPAEYEITIGDEFTAPTLANSQNVAVTYAATNVTPEGCIAVAENGTVTINAAGSATITASFAGNDTYNEASASYNLVVKAAALTTIDEIFAAATTAGSTATDCRVTFNNWVVSGVKNNNAYVTDNAGKGFIIYTSGHGFEVGDILSGTAACKVQLYNGAAELTNLKSSTEGLTVTKNGDITPVTSISIADLSGINTGAIVSYENLQYDGTNFIDGPTSLKPYNTFMTLPTLISGKNYNVTGVYIQYNATKEVAPRSAEDIVLVEVINNYVVTFDVTENGTIVVKNGETVINEGDEVAEGTTLTIECTPANEDYRFKNWQYKVEGGSWTAKYSAVQEYTMPSANVQFRANFELIPVYTINWYINSVVAKTENLKDGTSVSAPEVDDIEGKVFTGWAAETDKNYTNASVAPAYVNVEAATATADANYYAVFATQNGAGGAQTTLLSEDFSSITTGNSTATNGSGTAWTINDNFSDKVLAYQAGGAIRLGSSNNTGSLMTKTLDLSANNGAFTVEFDAKGWTTVEGQIMVTPTGCAAQTSNITAVMDGNFEHVIMNFTAGQANSTIVFATTAKRAFIDNIVVTTGGTATYSDYTTFVAPAPVTITISAALYTTYYNADYAYTMPEGCEGYTFTAANGLAKEYNAGEVVPAATPLVIKGTAAGNKDLVFTNEDGTAAENNELKGAATAMTADEMAAANEGANRFYSLSLNAAGEASSVGFYWFAEDGAAFAIPAHKVYLALTAENPTLAPKRFLFNQTDTATDLESVEANTAVKFFENGVLYIQKNGHVYNAMGQLVK